MTKDSIEKSQGKTLGNLYLGILEAGVSKEDAISLIVATVQPRKESSVSSDITVQEFLKYLKRLRDV